MSHLHQPLARGFPSVPDQDIKPCPPATVEHLHHHHQRHHQGFHSGANVSHDTSGSSSSTVAELANIISYDEVATTNHPNSTAMRALVTFLRDFMQTQSLYDRWTEPRYCPLSYCSEVLDSPYALIQHVLSCPQLATGQAECWRWQDWLESSGVGHDQWQNPSDWKGPRHAPASRERCSTPTPRHPNRRKHSSTPPGRSRMPSGAGPASTSECQRGQDMSLQIPNLEELSRILTKPQLDLIYNGLEELGGETADHGGADDGQSMDFDMNVSACTSPSVLSLEYSDFGFGSSRHSMQQDYHSMTTAYSDIDAQSQRSIAMQDADCDIELEVDHPMIPFWPTGEPHRMSMASNQRQPCPPLRTRDLGIPQYADQHYLTSPQSPFGCGPGTFSGAQHQSQHQHSQHTTQHEHLPSHLGSISGHTEPEAIGSFIIPDRAHALFALPQQPHAQALQPQAHLHTTPLNASHRRNSLSHFSTPSFHTRHASIDDSQRQPQLHHPQPQTPTQPQLPEARRASLVPTRTTPTPGPAATPTSAPSTSDDLVCDECQWKPRGVKENLRGYLRKHKNVHKNLKHACDVDGCTKSFSRLDNLKAHKKDKHPGLSTASGVDETPPPPPPSSSSARRSSHASGSASTSSGSKRRDHRGPGWVGPSRAMLWSMQM